LVETLSQGIVGLDLDGFISVLAYDKFDRLLAINKRRAGRNLMSVGTVLLLQL
ncbi:MAG: hypothetical protein K0S80_1398, partial [Neobacillus sp.]|nr:hypothetical protein [Neobacillus sp.]